MPKAKIERAAEVIKRLYGKRFSGKRMGRLTLTHEQVCGALDVKNLHTSTLHLLIDELMEEKRLVMGVTGIKGLYSVVHARKAAAWRRVPRSDFWDTVLEVDPDAEIPDDEGGGDTGPEDEDE